ncbi:MAG: response regulator, partial [Steroidobacteraceae bacterium]
QAAQPAGLSPATAASRMGSGSIVIVDDERALTILMTRMLERHGFRVTAFTDPRLALDHLRTTGGSVDVLVTDMSMPAMSGFHLVQAVREILPLLPIVVATGYLRQEDIDAGNDLGVSRFVLKPDQFEQIGAILGELLGVPGGAVAGR